MATDHRSNMGKASRIRATQAAIIIASIVVVVGLYKWLSKSPAGSLRILCYVGYDENDFLEAFASDTGIAIETKTYFGGDQMFAYLSQSESQYDVVVVDPEYLDKLVTAKRLEPLNALDFSFERNFKAFNDLRVGWVDGQLYGVPVRFGFNGLVFNKVTVSEQDVGTFNVIWNPKYEKRVGLVDWYLLSMGAISKSIGNDDPYDISEERFNLLLEKMRELKPGLAAIYDIPAMYRAFETGEMWLLPCGGESVVFNLQGKGDFDWTIPREGGLVWVETLVIPQDAPRKAAARKFISWAQGAKAQSLLMKRQAYASNVPNKDAYNSLPESEKSIFKAVTEESVSELLAKCRLRRLPTVQKPERWQDEWTKFKALR
jgi:spermidine/putrescine transport system substrate-binding protein